MAEPFSTVATALSLLALLDVVVKDALSLKDFLSRLQKAPKDLENLKDEIEMLHHMLHTAKGDLQSYSSISSMPGLLQGPSLSRVVQEYSVAIQKTRALIVELQQAVTNESKTKMIGRIRFASRKAKIDHYRNRIQQFWVVLNFQQQNLHEWVCTYLREIAN